MQKEVEDFVGTCDRCQRNKDKGQGADAALRR